MTLHNIYFHGDNIYMYFHGEIHVSKIPKLMMNKSCQKTTQLAGKG